MRSLSSFIKAHLQIIAYFALYSLEDSRGHPLKFGGRKGFCINHTWKGSKLKIRCVPPWYCWAFRDFDMFMTVSGQNRVKGVKIQFVVK